MTGFKANPIISNLVKPYPSPDRVKPAKAIPGSFHFFYLLTKTAKVARLIKNVSSF